MCNCYLEICNSVCWEDIIFNMADLVCVVRG